MTDTSIIIGLGVVTFIIFDLWVEMRKNQPIMSIFFFITGMAGLNILTFIVSEMMKADNSLTAYPAVSNLMFMFVMWLSIGITVYIIIMTFKDLFGLMIDWFKALIGQARKKKA